MKVNKLLFYLLAFSIANISYCRNRDDDDEDADFDDRNDSPRYEEPKPSERASPHIYQIFHSPYVMPCDPRVSQCPPYQPTVVYQPYNVNYPERVIPSMPYYPAQNLPPTPPARVAIPPQNSAQGLENDPIFNSEHLYVKNLDLKDPKVLHEEIAAAKKYVDEFQKYLESHPHIMNLKGKSKKSGKKSKKGETIAKDVIKKESDMAKQLLDDTEKVFLSKGKAPIEHETTTTQKIIEPATTVVVEAKKPKNSKSPKKKSSKKKKAKKEVEQEAQEEEKEKEQEEDSEEEPQEESEDEEEEEEDKEEEIEERDDSPFEYPYHYSQKGDSYKSYKPRDF